jgi:ubiquinone/menaquinone biosynthesis C-methylase UbiE
MNVSEAVVLLGSTVPRATAKWADLGSGDGTFTLALAQLLEANSHIYAVDRDEGALRTLKQRVVQHGVGITAIVADFTTSFDPPGAGTLRLDGMLFANSLHFVSDPEVVLARLVQWLQPEGRVVFVEYDRRPASRWVPYPIDAATLPRLCEAAGLSRPIVTATRPSNYGGEMYVAYADRRTKNSELRSRRRV